MYTIDRDQFFAGYRKQFGSLPQGLVDAVNTLLERIENDARFDATLTDRQKIAYCLATFKWETANTMLPIDEIGSDAYFNRRYGPGTRVGKMLGNTQAGDGARFHGRGPVQLTGRANYLKASRKIGVDLIENPELAKDPDIGYEIAIWGMLEGWFTGRRLGQYFKPGAPPDWKGARKIINGTDRDDEIAAIARKFDTILAASVRESADVQTSVPTITTVPLRPADRTSCPLPRRGT